MLSVNATLRFGSGFVDVAVPSGVDVSCEPSCLFSRKSGLSTAWAAHESIRTPSGDRRFVWFVAPPPKIEGDGTKDSNDDVEDCDERLWVRGVRSSVGEGVIAKFTARSDDGMSEGPEGSSYFPPEVTVECSRLVPC